MAIRVHASGGGDGALFRAARDADEAEVRRLLASPDTNINAVDPETGYTALHIAAARSARAIVRLLVATRGCDFAIKDRQGRTAATLAYVLGEDPALCRFLLGKQYPVAATGAAPEGERRTAV